MKKSFIALLSAFSMLVATNCYGGFVATKKVYSWNGGLGNKWVQSIVFWVMIIIPVYEVVALVDFLVLNTLEFWTGSNPMAMKDGEVETQIVHNGGKEYQITATKNQFEVREIAAGKLGNPVYLTFVPQDSAWYMKTNGKSVKVSEATNLAEGQIKLFHPDGKTVETRL
jgi:hypothetical protein